MSENQQKKPTQISIEIGELIWRFHAIVMSYAVFKLGSFYCGGFIFSGIVAAVFAIQLFRLKQHSVSAKVNITLILLCPIWAALASIVPNPDGSFGNTVLLSEILRS